MCRQTPLPLPPPKGDAHAAMTAATAILTETLPRRDHAAALADRSRIPSVRMWSGRRRAIGPAVRRPRLVHRLGDPDAPPLALVVAPAGYGKSTLLREWDACDPRPFAWVELGLYDNDVGRLRARVTAAVDAAVGDDADAPFVLILDDAHLLYRRAAIEGLGAIANELPARAGLALASRRELDLPVARLRAEHLVCELGPRELAMSRPEAAALLRGAGHRVDAEALELLLHRTEGWPVGIGLAARFLDERRSAGALARFGGADRIIAQYVRDELLAELPPALVQFAVRTSLVETLTGPLCDALLQRWGSGSTLAALARAGVAVRLDRTEEHFRYHRLVAETLRAELRRTEPEREAVLHLRASAWHRGEGDVDRALDHALRAGDSHEAADLVWSNAAASLGQGRSAAVERWLARLNDADIARHPTLALTSAGCALARGQGHLVDHWTSVATAAAAMSGAAPAVYAGVAVMRAAIADAGAAQMRAEAARALALQPDRGPWRSLCNLIGGAARHLAGERDAAARQLQEGARGAAVTAPLVHALCLAELAVLALEREDWESAGALVARARAQLDRHALGSYAAAALVYAVSALVRAHRGQVADAQPDLQDAVRLRATLTDFPSWYEAEVCLLLARASLRLSDVSGARDLVAQSAHLVERAAGAVVLQGWLVDVRTQLEAFIASDRANPACLTAAELRVLRYLPTHMSFREIGEHTCVSGNTVKSQANAIYRKLDVSCRSDAVERARGCGLLDD
jgi:LuxR family transcriptional regulator, maltose regulon positive regulatory protein